MANFNPDLTTLMNATYSIQGVIQVRVWVMLLILKGLNMSTLVLQAGRAMPDWNLPVPGQSGPDPDRAQHLVRFGPEILKFWMVKSEKMSICLPSLVSRKWNGFCLSRGAISSHEWPKVTSGWKWHRVRSKNHWIVLTNQWRWTMSFS